MSLKVLQEALKGARRDEFEKGTVIRWLASARFTYAAIKTDVGWFTTASPTNPFIQQVVSFDDLIEYLSASEVTDIEVASEWTPIN